MNAAIKDRALEYLSGDFPNGWRPHADALLRYPLVKIWADLESLGCTDDQLGIVLDAILQTAFDSVHNDPREAMRRYSEAADRVVLHASELWKALEAFRDTEIDALQYHDQVNTDLAWSHQRGVDWEGLDSALQSVWSHAGGARYLANREIPKHRRAGKSIHRQFCEKLDERFRYHIHISKGLPEGSLLTHEALAELVAALFGETLSAETIKKYDLTRRKG